MSDGWRADMENAPRDGTPILVWNAAQHCVEPAHFCHHDFWCCHAKDEEPWYAGHEDEGCGRVVEPTHWMPMPAPPEGA